MVDFLDKGFNMCWFISGYPVIEFVGDPDGLLRTKWGLWLASKAN